MAHQKPTSGTKSGRSRGIGTASGSRASGAEAVGAGGERELTEVDREVIEALAGFRDTLRHRMPLETRYTGREVVSVAPPSPLAPADVRAIRESLGLSQPVFADFLGTSHSTVRSWEQGQKPPSPMARRFLGLIAADPPYWKGLFRSMVRTRGGETQGTESIDRGAISGAARDVVHERPRAATGKKGLRKKSGSKMPT